ncbi:MAG: hypothetical protein HY910_10800 [Desulfarculus sp.]|nr:hypothetical protein [Desulfarculus sp.]
MPKPRLALVLANSFAARNTLRTPVLAELAARAEMEVVILTPFPRDQEIIQATGAGHLSWALLSKPAQGVGLAYGGAWATARRLAQRACMRPLHGLAGLGNLVYRFNEIHQFVGHLQKKDLPPEQRAREAQAGNFVDPGLGRPWPASRAMLDWLYRLYYATWYNEPAVEAFLDRFQPHLMVLHHLQFESIRPYNTAARRRGIPILGIVASWDQPTTKGPLCPGVERYLVHSRRMREELARWHGVAPERVEVVGWPQMDIYHQPGTIRPRAQFLAELGLDPGRRLLLLGANSARLGPHEPGIARHLAGRISQDPAWADVTLVVRPHPNDNQWATRFSGLHQPPGVLLLAPEWGRLDFLANLLAHSQALLATGGTIHLDAVALDTCAVAIGFAGDLAGEMGAKVRQWYQMDHYAPVLQSGGVRLVASYAELDQALEAYLADPGLDAPGRARCRAEQLEPLDGGASRRLVQALLEAARRAARGR